MNVDVLVVISYLVSDPGSSVIYTNARPEALEEVLSAWVQDQVGHGRDPVPFIERSSYTIKIGLDVSTDSFATASDTGNRGLTAGLVMEIMKMLGSIAVRSLAERPQEAIDLQ